MSVNRYSIRYISVVFSQIIAVIFSNTGIALLAYMDGISQTRTLGGVVLGAAAAAGSAVYKVTFKLLRLKLVIIRFL